MKSLRNRVEALERVAQRRDDGLRVRIKNFAGDGVEAGSIKVAGVMLKRLTGEADDAYLERAFSMAPVVGDGVRVIDEYEAGC